jgi:hypothetical protein
MTGLVVEFVPGYEASIWYGFGAPKNTLVPIIDKLNRKIDAGLADPKLHARPDSNQPACLFGPYSFARIPT